MLSEEGIKAGGSACDFLRRRAVRQMCQTLGQVSDLSPDRGGGELERTRASDDFLEPHASRHRTQNRAQAEDDEGHQENGDQAIEMGAQAHEPVILPPDATFP